jgi:phage terminase large subunit-like protein
MNLQNLHNQSEEQLRALASAVKALSDKQKYNFIETIFPDEGPLRRELYPKHIEFLNAGSQYDERAFISANRTGKSLTGIYEVVTHCIGDYPSWWKGKKFNKPVFCWVCGETGDIVRDSIQRDLIGYDGMGTGIIPKDKYAKEPFALQGVSGAFGQYFIKHKSGGVSTIIIKTYHKGVAGFEAAKVDVVMLDEQCPLDIYVECKIRTMTTNGIVFLTFTPTKGLTDTVLHFTDPPEEDRSKPRFVINVGWDDVPHLSKEQKEKMLAEIPPHMRDVRSKGLPYLGTGAIYPVAEQDILVKPFKIPNHWPRAYGFDPGWNKTAAVWGAHDKENDILYLYSEYYKGYSEPVIHASGIKARGAWIPGVSDPAARSGGRGKDGIAFLEAYENEGLTLSMADNSVEVGLMDVYQRLSTGRLKVFNTLQNWLYEYRIYRRNDAGLIVKKNDHLMDATRYLVRSGFSVMEPVPEDDEDDRNIPDVGRSSITGY